MYVFTTWCQNQNIKLLHLCFTSSIQRQISTAVTCYGMTFRTSKNKIKTIKLWYSVILEMHEYLTIFFLNILPRVLVCSLSYVSCILHLFPLVLFMLVFFKGFSFLVLLRTRVLDLETWCLRTLLWRENGYGSFLWNLITLNKRNFLAWAP